MHSFRSLVPFLCFVQTIWGQAPYDPSPFSMVGTIDSMTLNTTGGILAGGTITIDGIEIIVPQNLLTTLPSITVAWSELFVNGVPNLPGSADTTWEALVQGNRVRNQYIAGLVFPTQKAARLLQGFVTDIDPTNGHFFVAGDFGTSGSAAGIECVINDPVGRYYVTPYTANPLWAADTENPSIHAVNGFPMCINSGPNDKTCPTKNRPNDAGTGKPVQIFTFADPATISATEPDARIAMPLAVGDYITFSGVEVGGGLLAVYNLVANLGIYTAAGKLPAYIACDSVNYAVYGTTSPTVAFSETRAVAWSTDITQTMTWYAIDIDPCTGTQKKRPLVSNFEPSNTNPLGQCQFRGRTGGAGGAGGGGGGLEDFSPATQSVGFDLSGGTFVTANNLTAGTFTQPVFVYLFPELITIGDPMLPNVFESIPFLAAGSGPLVLGNQLSTPLEDAPIVGQLSPWPGATAPAPTSCPPPSTTTTSISSISTTLVTSTSTSTSSSPPPVDSVTVTSATSSHGSGGITTVVVTAQSNNPAAILSCAITGTDTAGPTPMTSLGGGKFTISFSIKGNKVTNAVVTSNLGGTGTLTIT